ncbi:RNA-guided endonuclease InsQ/TnpB family protein [Coleofasciculus sp. F4-SAH-05]|uniref:RNA-guided endonuclease InsQ/TnpB family protein n=1 Tax=Coleofasciculus sp. F4-SAH-05 TaxID=3069525 RepID=UPI0032FFE037
MITSYQYRLKPNYEQRCRLTRWLDMLRCQYNWLLAERFDWWEMNRTTVNACPNTCSIAEPKEQPEYYGQKRSLVQLKQERPGYQDIHAHVLQEVVKRVNLAFQRFLKGDSNGKRSGKPRFKGKNRYRTITFPSIKPDCIQGNRIIFPKFGAIKFIQHRPTPAGIAGFLNEILPDKAEKAGKRVIKVNPAGTSQHCAVCLNRVSKSLSERWHDCPHCGASMPRDLCSGILIKKVGLGIASLKNAKSRKRDGEARALIYD